MVDVSLAPIVSGIAPLIVAAAGVIIPAAVTWAAMKFSQMTHINIQKAALDKLSAAANAEAGALVAAAEGNLAGVSIVVGNPMIAAAAARVINAVPGALDATGLTPSHVATMVAGGVGALQARMSSPTPPALPKPS